MVLSGWLVLWAFFIKGTKALNNDELEKIKSMIRRKYEELGPMTYEEKAVTVVFSTLVGLWLTRNPGFMPGWGSVYPFNLKDAEGKKYVTDATVAVFMAFVLFCIPKYPITKSRRIVPLISFKECCKMMSWTVLFLLGGGFAMAEGIQLSGLGSWIGIQLYFLEGTSEWVLVASIIFLCSFTTQFMANTGKLGGKLNLEGTSTILCVQNLIYFFPFFSI